MRPEERPRSAKVARAQHEPLPSPPLLLSVETYENRIRNVLIQWIHNACSELLGSSVISSRMSVSSAAYGPALLTQSDAPDPPGSVLTHQQKHLPSEPTPHRPRDLPRALILCSQSSQNVARPDADVLLAVVLGREVDLGQVRSSEDGGGEVVKEDRVVGVVGEGADREASWAG